MFYSSFNAKVANVYYAVEYIKLMIISLMADMEMQYIYIYIYI